VSVRVEDRLFGAAVPGTVQLPYAALHESPRGPARVLAHIWSGVTLRTNAPVIVVLGQSTSDSPRADTPRVVTSSQQNIEIIRSLVSEALRLETSPESIHDAIASLAHVQNPALAGFLVVHLRRIDTIHNPDTAATLLVQIVDNENVPASEREDIVDSIVLDYDRLTDGNRALIVSRFAKLGASEDAGLAALGLRGLVKISDFDQSVGTMVPASAVGAIGRNYRTLMARGALAHSDALEKVLGIR
jgi:hypothetical protein